MAVPAFLRTVDRQMYIDTRSLCPYFLDLFQFYEVICGTWSVQDVNRSVVITIIQYIVDNGTQWCKSDTTGDKQQIFAFQLCIYRKIISVRSTDSNLIANFQAVQTVCQYTTFFNTEFLIFFICRGWSNGEHCLSDTRYTYHCTLSRHMFEQFSAARSSYTECFYIRCFLRDLCDHTNLRNQCIQCIIFMTGTFAHYCSPPMLLITLTIFKEDGHFSTQRPHPTQEYMPSLFAGK